MIEDILSEADQKMAAAVEHTQQELAKMRTGRANPSLIADLPVEYYGSPTPLQQLAGISVPEPRMLQITPFDKTALKEIERSIGGSDLGLNPSNDGNVIRVVFPELTEERRKEFVKLAKERAEDGRVAVRNIRRHAKSDIGKLAEGGDIGEDDERRADKRLQDLTDKHVARIDEVLSNKEKELMEV